MNGTYEVTSEPFETGYFKIDEERNTTIVVVMANADGYYHAALIDSEGNVACESDMGEGMFKTYTSTVLLDEGEYEIIITNDDDCIGQNPTYNIRVQ
jgi:hypothetical protein